eukprot:129100_1
MSIIGIMMEIIISMVQIFKTIIQTIFILNSSIKQVSTTAKRSNLEIALSDMLPNKTKTIQPHKIQVLLVKHIINTDYLLCYFFIFWNLFIVWYTLYHKGCKNCTESNVKDNINIQTYRNRIKMIMKSTNYENDWTLK